MKSIFPLGWLCTIEKEIAREKEEIKRLGLDHPSGFLRGKLPDIVGASLELMRFCWTEKYGTFGVLTMPGKALRLYTVERQWQNNEPWVSCIPTGEYVCKRGQMQSSGKLAFDVQDVRGRTHIKIHAANLASELAGCIAPGTTLGTHDGYWAVENSAHAMLLINQALDEFNTFKLTIGDHPAGHVVR
jgi:hypothetical protein